jgi:hypothetical protein
MKKTILMLAMTGALVVNMTSCKKGKMHRAPVTETINVQLKLNEAYTFTLPKNLRDDEYEFKEQASHASISALGKNANGDRVYSYTPALNYSGLDRVIVSNNEEAEEHEMHGQCGNHNPPPPPKGNCDGKGGEEDHYIITINFDVRGSSVISSK